MQARTHNKNIIRNGTTVKKITSTNPTVYYDLSLERAIDFYAVYIVSYVEMRNRNNANSLDYKTFEQWLLTEI